MVLPAAAIACAIPIDSAITHIERHQAAYERGSEYEVLQFAGEDFLAHAASQWKEKAEARLTHLKLLAVKQIVQGLLVLLELTL